MISEFTGGLDYMDSVAPSSVGTGARGLWVETADASMAVVEGSLASKQDSACSYTTSNT
jgi:hypothetical protein